MHGSVELSITLSQLLLEPLKAVMAMNETILIPRLLFLMS